MTATHILPALTVPDEHPLAPVDTISKAAMRRREIQLIEEEVVGAAMLAGWKKPRRKVYSNGHSIYVNLKLGGRRRVVIRFSDHAPSRPLGLDEDAGPTIVCTLEVPGNITQAIRWLEKTAVDHLSRHPASGQGEGVAV